MNKRTETRVHTREPEWAAQYTSDRNGKLRSLFESNILPLVVWHQDGRIRDANEAFLKLVRYSRDSLGHGTLRWDSITPAEYLTKDERAIRELLCGKVVCTPFEKEYICGDGRRIPVVVGGALFPNCKDKGIAFALDVANYPSAEQALAARRYAIASVYAALLGFDRLADLEKLESVAAAIPTTLTRPEPSAMPTPEPSAMLAHEMRQPLATILSNAQAAWRLLYQRSPNRDELKAIIRDIIAEDRRASQLIDQFRLSGISTTQSFQLIQINAVIREVLHGLRHRLAERGIESDLALAPHLPMVRGDRSQLHQLFVNLYSNACEALAHAGATSRKLLTRTENTGWVSIEIHDHGPGIPPHELETVFQPFFSKKKGGMGIGLYICRAIVRSHGGRIWATSPPGGGASFHISLPAVVK